MAARMEIKKNGLPTSMAPRNSIGKEHGEHKGGHLGHDDLQQDNPRPDEETQDRLTWFHDTPTSLHNADFRLRQPVEPEDKIHAGSPFTR